MKCLVKSRADRQRGEYQQQCGEKSAKRRLGDKLQKRSFAFHLHLISIEQNSGLNASLIPRHFPQQFLYFFWLPHGHGSLRPTFGPARFGFGFETSSAAWLTISLAFDCSDFCGSA